MIAYTEYSDLEQFPAWGYGKQTLEVLKEKGLCRKVEELINNTYKDTPKDVYDINNFLSDDRDEIAKYIGYKNWDSLKNGTKVV